MTCPTCERPAIHAAPCSECWRSLSPAEKAPWLRRIRRDDALAGLRHRDPVRDAPPTLAAYVLFLEAKIARLEVACSP